MYIYIYLLSSVSPLAPCWLAVSALAPGRPVLMGARPCLASAATTQGPRAKAPHAPRPA